MSIDRFVVEQGITEVMHFTTNRGFVGTLVKGEVLSRHRLPSEESLEHLWRANASSRPEAAENFDKSQNWLDYVNLSISEVNSRYFLVSTRWHAESDYWWILMSFAPEIMTHDGVVFATTNNGYDRCIRCSGLAGLQALFAPVIQRKSPEWQVSRVGRESRLPTCEQAEVLYPRALSTKYLCRVYVREAEQGDIVAGWIREFGYKGVEVIVSPEKFAGRPN